MYPPIANFFRFERKEATPFFAWWSSPHFSTKAFSGTISPPSTWRQLREKKKHRSNISSRARFIFDEPNPFNASDMPLTDGIIGPSGGFFSSCRWPLHLLTRRQQRPKPPPPRRRPRRSPAVAFLCCCASGERGARTRPG